MNMDNRRGNHGACHGSVVLAIAGAGQEDSAMKSPISRIIFACGIAAIGVPVAAATTSPAAPSPALTAEASAALTAMSAYLRGMKSFEVTGTGSSEAPLDSGQKVEFAVGLHYVVAQPDRLKASFNIGARARQLFYDGSTLTITAPDQPYYAQMPITGSLRTLLAEASTRYDIDLPLESLFRWGDATRPAERPTSGFEVGTAACGTAVCDQFAFRQTGFDWQMWVPRGGRPLPVRLVVNGRVGTAPPHTAMDRSWNTDRPIAPGEFAFVAPAGATRISIKAAGQTTGAK